MLIVLLRYQLILMEFKNKFLKNKILSHKFLDIFCVVFGLLFGNFLLFFVKKRIIFTGIIKN